MFVISGQGSARSVRLGEDNACVRITALKLIPSLTLGKALFLCASVSPLFNRDSCWVQLGCVGKGGLLFSVPLIRASFQICIGPGLCQACLSGGSVNQRLQLRTRTPGFSSQLGP